MALRILLLLSLSWTSHAVSSDPWGQCPVSRKCKDKFRDGKCDQGCKEPECLMDGFDCVQDRPVCNPGHIQYCRNHYGNSHCDHGCNSATCGWDGADCVSQQSPLWAKGTLLVHTRLPLTQGAFTNSSVLWALSVVLQSPLKLRGAAPFGPSRDLFHYGPGQLQELLKQSADADASGSLLALQVDNRPCSSMPSTCFPYTTEAASFLRAMLQLQQGVRALLPELQAVVSLRGLREEVGSRDEEEVRVEVKAPMASWMWAVVAVALGLVLLLCVAVLLAMRRVRQRAAHAGGAHGSSQVGRRTLSMGARPAKTKASAWGGAGSVADPRVPSAGSRDRDKLGLRRKKKAKEQAEKRRRREPLGEDAMRMRPLRREQDIGSDTDVTQSSMEDISRCSKRHEAFICEHRGPAERAYRGSAGQGRSAAQAPPRGWERNAMPPPLLSPPQHSAEWCGPDGSVVLIRAVRSGLDRVVLELLRAGVPVNNTDHTGRSALHWACSVNHLSLARTLIRYGAAVDLQDNKGETALFLSALHGCYDTARLLLLHGANLDLRDRRGRHAVDAAQEAMHHQILEMLLAHQMQRRPAQVDTSCDVLWDDRAVGYPSWGGAQAMPGRSASFSGTIGALPQSDWSPGRVQYPSPHTWRPQIHQSTTALVPPRVMGRSPRPITTLQEVTSEDEDRERPQDVPRAITPHFLSPQPAPRQRSFSCTQHALQRRPSAPQPEPNYVIVTPPAANDLTDRALAPPSENIIQPNSPTLHAENLNRAEPAAVSPAHMEQKSRERPQSHGDPTQTAL